MKIRRYYPSYNSADDLPLFRWAARHQPRVHRTYPGRVLKRRHGLSPHQAELIARLCGLGGCR